ncbi:MAG: hypothetical protein LBD75_07180, partial [Candidatus Peribacteria bacterium]|nr:hypothetical protein [Candidatus Peribacteria bacterium]
ETSTAQTSTSSEKGTADDATATKDTSQEETTKEEETTDTQESVEPSKKVNNKWERLTEHNAQLKNQLTKTQASLTAAEKKLEELQNDDTFDDVDKKEEAIADTKATISYHKNRINELKDDETSAREEVFQEICDSYALSEKERKSFDEFAKLGKYKALEPEEVFALYTSSKGGRIQIDKALLHQKESVSLIGEDRKSFAQTDVSKMSPEQQEAYLRKEIESGGIVL